MPRPKTIASEYKRLTLRIPPDLLALLQAQAQAIGRPLNTHALFVLRAGLGLDSSLPIPGEAHASRRSKKR